MQARRYAAMTAEKTGKRGFRRSRPVARRMTNKEGTTRVAARTSRNLPGIKNSPMPVMIIHTLAFRDLNVVRSFSSGETVTGNAPEQSAGTFRSLKNGIVLFRQKRSFMRPSHPEDGTEKCRLL